MVAEDGFPVKVSLGFSGKEGGEMDRLDDSDNGLRSSDGKIHRNAGGSERKPLEMMFSGEGTSKRTGTMGFQELTLSYMCDTSKGEKDSGKNSVEDLRIGLGKGKETVTGENPAAEEGSGRWIERDFLELSGERGFKRENGGEGDKENEKKPKLDGRTPLDLSLALPSVSLSLSSFVPSRNCDPPVILPPTRGGHSLPPSRANSDDFTASASYCYSVPFSHNPSCSLNENLELTVSNGRTFGGGNEHIWHCGEGTNGSVHSRFKPVGELSPLQIALQNGVIHGDRQNQEHASFSNHGYPSIPGQNIKDGLNSVYNTNSADRSSFFPLELPARPTKDNQSVDSAQRNSERQKLGGSKLVHSEGGSRTPLFQRSQNHVGGGQSSSRVLTRPERLLNEIIAESIPLMAQVIQEIAEESLESAKVCLKDLASLAEKREEFAGLQHRLGRRSDLTPETLSKAHGAQLDILVTVKTGVVAYLSPKTRLPTEELVEVFMSTRCKNPNCKSLLPVDDCDCKICSTKKGFCGACMCQICFNFDCAFSTCSWVGCDVCSHWCHAECGVRFQYIKPGPSLKGAAGTREMQFHCLGCGHASELFGFVKEVFTCCAVNWDPETLTKELDCVRRIFQGSSDPKGKALHVKAEEMILKLDKKLASPSDVCNSMLSFLKGRNITLLEINTDGVTEFPLSENLGKELPQPSQKTEASLPSSRATTSQATADNSPFKRDAPCSTYKMERVLHSERRDETDMQQFSTLRRDGFDSLESIVKIKDAEARMFQSRADDARREAESLRKIVRAKTAELEEEYSSKIAKLCLQETEEKRRKKLEELKLLENSHCDYFNMKMRMETEIAGMLKRMEATKQQWM